MEWNPDIIALSLGPLQFSWYGLMWSSSLIIGYFIAKFMFKKEHKDLESLAPISQVLFLGCIIGARVFDVFYYNFDLFLKDPFMLFRIWEGGLASHGAVIGTIVAFWIYTKFNKKFSLIWLLDRCAVIFPLLGGLIRIGNFVNSELYGKVTTLPWGVKFVATDPLALTRHPIQLYEAIWLFSCFTLFFTLYTKGKQRFNGFFTSIFFIVVFLGRLILEFMKEAEPVLFGFSQTQLVSVCAVLLGIGLFLWLKNKAK